MINNLNEFIEKSIKVLEHSSIKINLEKIIYVDPFNIKKEYKDADYIFITHSHYDHFSEKDILKIKKENTKIIITEDLFEKVKEMDFEENKIIIVEPNREYIFDEIKINTIYSYNTNKEFHPKENNWVGYIFNIENIKVYIAGDTDITDENKNLKCDIALVPIGGTYTMDSKEAAELINIIRPKYVIPTHYGSLVGKKCDAEEIISNLDEDINYKIFIK